MDEVRYCPYCMTPVKENGVCPACGLTEGSYVPAPHHLLPGTVLQDRYLIGRVLGEGGFGITYVGRDTRLGLKIAVKEYYPVGNAARNNQESVTVTSSSRTTGTYEKGKSKFLQEAMTMGKLEKEPQIVGVKDFFQENNTAYIVMEYIEGTTLKELTAQRGGRIPADELFEMIKPMFGAIQHMHDLGLIHRDISPDNLMLENGDIKLLDFGCAKDVTDSSQVNQQTQTLILKHGYSPFEQYQMSSNQGPWTDVYAFGASIYYCLTGNPPPRSTDRIMGDNIVPPHKLGIKITERQEDALMKALAVRPVDRFSSMNQFQGALYGNTVETVVSEKAQKKGQIRKPKQKKTAPAMGLTVREKLFDNPEEEPEEVSSETEPAKDPDRILTAEEKPLFVTDEIVVPKDKLEEKKKSGNKTVIIAVVAIILVIALAVTGIVWAIVGSNSGSKNNNDTSGYLNEKWFKIEGVAIDSYHEDGASYDASTRTIEYTDAKAAIGWEFDEGATLDYIEVNLSERNVGVNLVVNYSDGTLTQTGYKFTNTMTLDIDSGKTVSSIVLRNGEDTGTVIISSVKTNAEDDEEEVIVAEESSSDEPIFSMDIDITVGTEYYGTTAISTDYAEWDSFVEAVATGKGYVAITADSPDVLLALQIPSGWTYTSRVTAIRNDDGTYTSYFKCSDIVDTLGSVDIWTLLCIDSLTWEEEIHVTKIEVVDEIPAVTDGVITVSENGISTYLNHADFTDENMYLEITYLPDFEFDEYDGDNDSADWGVGNIWSVDENGNWLHKVGREIPCYHETNGTYAISLPELAEMFASTGNELSYGIVIENYATDYLLSFDVQLVTADHQISTSIDGGTGATTIDIRSVPNAGNEVTVWVNVEDGYVLTSFYAVSDGNELELTLIDCGDHIYRFTMPDAGVTLYAKLVSADALNLVCSMVDGYDYTLSDENDKLNNKYVDFEDESLYLCITYNYWGTDSMPYIGSITYCSADDVNYLSKDRVCNVLKYESGKAYISLKELGDMAEASGYEDGGFYFWLCVDDIEILEYSIVSYNKVETVLYSEKMTDSDMLDFLQDYDFTDPELYLYIYYDLLDDDYIGWGPVGISTPNWDIIIGGANGRFLGADESGLITVSLVEIKEAFEDAGFDVSDGVLLNWWANDNNNDDDHYANLTRVAVVRVTG